MEFENQFSVPVLLNEAWTILLDIEKIAPCVPGAELTEIVDENTFKGKVSVKLGPVALTLNGQTCFDEIDEKNKSAQLTAQGNDTKGRGGANAKVAFTMKEDDGATIVFIKTKLQLSGAVAQYGRGVGMVKDLAQQIIDQFATNLKENVIASPTESFSSTSDGSTKQAAPVQVGSMGIIVLWRAIVRGFNRIFGLNR